jgi:hypothetical protein
MKLVQNPTTGVMAGTLHMAGQVERNLGGGDEPSVGFGVNPVEWQPPQSTNQQIETNMQGE